MTIRIEFSCDARNCPEHHVLLVDEAWCGEMQQTITTLRFQGWRITKGQRPSSTRTSKLRMTCPKHTGTKR